MKPKQIPKYLPSQIEAKWAKKWEESKIYQPDLDKAKKPFYNLMMFPYPSAEGLHVGSVFTFTGVDTYGRFKRMQGYDVFEPMGLDGFGIHSENYALKVGRHPKVQAKISEENFYRQLRSIGNSFDWSRKLETYDPNYYKWTQWIFIQLFKKGLAFRGKAPVNFCPSCKTVLSDEQVIDGKCERCGTIVEKKDLEQWFFRITTYADRLLNNLEKLDWTAKVKIAQREWIGRSEGLVFTAPVKDSDLKIQTFSVHFEAFYADTFVVIAPDHPLLEELLKDSPQKKEAMDFCKVIIEKRKKKGYQGEKEIEGIFTGKYVVDPVGNGDLPIWVASYALREYGTGIVKCSAHDTRDFAFAQKYGIRLKPVLFPKDPEHRKRIENLEECFTDMKNGYLSEPSKFAGKRAGEVRQEIIKYAVKKGFAKQKTNYHLRDWLISRQRYWGPPIPMVYCQSCADKGISYSSTKSEGRVEKPALSASNVFSTSSNSKDMAGWFPVPEDQLPVLLPDVKDWKPLGTGKSPLANHPEFYEVACPQCGKAARRETDVSDTFLDSAWYFFRYIGSEFDTVPFPSEAFINSKSEARNPKWFDKLTILSGVEGQIQNTNNKNSKQFRISNFDIRASAQRAQRWLPVHMYIGGAEHSVLHLLYSRFITMVFKDIGLIDFEEPYSRFYAHGLIIKEGAKMSKSKGNVVNPDQYLAKYGADVLRAYLRFVGPFDRGGDFRDSGIEGMERFLRRIWILVTSKNFTKDGQIDTYLKKLTHEITVELEHLRFNTAVARLMMYYNFLVKKQSGGHSIFKSEILNFIKLLAPFVPFLAEELWEHMGQHFSVHTQSWPKIDEEQLKDMWGYVVAIQINGKTKATMGAEELLSQEEAESRAKEMNNVKKYVEGKEIKKVVYVPGKIINFVV